jgi:hypothetical protein
MLQLLCNRLLNELIGQRCTMLAGHDGPCQAVKWSERYFAAWLKRQETYMESIGARQKLPNLPHDVENFVRNLD